MKNVGEFYKKIILKPLLKVRKRYRVVFSTFFLSFFFLFSTFFFSGKFLLFLFLLIIFTYLAVYFSILEGIERVEWVMLFLMPVYVVAVLYVFYFMFPVRWLTRLPFLFIFGVSVYSMLLTSNILNEGVEKALQLYRAAFSINYLFQSIVVFLLGTVIYSFARGPFFNVFLIAILTYPLALQFVWSIKLNLSLEKEDFRYAVLLTLIPSEVAFLFSFAPLSAVVFGLLVSAFYYYTAGYIYLLIEKRLFPETLREFNIVLILVVIFLLLSLRYG